jgi:hypothetical protein
MNWQKSFQAILDKVRCQDVHRLIKQVLPQCVLGEGRAAIKKHTSRWASILRLVTCSVFVAKGLGMGNFE